MPTDDQQQDIEIELTARAAFAEVAKAVLREALAQMPPEARREAEAHFAGGGRIVVAAFLPSESVTVYLIDSEGKIVKVLAGSAVLLEATAGSA